MSDTKADLPPELTDSDLDPAQWQPQNDMPKNYRLVIAEDHTILREGLRALLAQESNFEVVAEVDNGRDAVRAVGALKPDLALVDLSMPGIDGLTAIREIKRRYPEIRLLVLTVHKTEEYIRAALEAGSSGYVLKDATRQELLIAIQTVLDGKTYISPAISERIISGFLDGGKAPNVHTACDALTGRERQIMKLVAEGRRNKEIAEYLNISVKTVEKHRANLMSKLNLHTASALTAFAIENGIVERQ